MNYIDATEYLARAKDGAITEKLKLEDVQESCFVGCFIGASVTTGGCTIADNKRVQRTLPPQIHFSPLQHWMNDPNGMVYYKGIYHLFFQYYPNGTVWGPMHWGHATSVDMVHWKEHHIALYPDSLGYIFLGSAVIDYQNTSGFGIGGKVPMVAIFTNHNPKGEEAGKDGFQNESIAYSLDEGETWTNMRVILY